VRRRLSVVSGMPVFEAASRWEMPEAERRCLTTAANPRWGVLTRCSIRSNVAPIWDTRKGNAQKLLFRCGYLVDLFRYLCAVTDTKRERSPWSDAVAAQIRAERAARGLTQADMVERSGVPRSTYIRLERGQRVADSTQLARLCAVWELRVSEFFARVEGERYPEEEATDST